jgi:uncharacterized protein YdhG (YjbR/CyaY superfamily)
MMVNNKCSSIDEYIATFPKEVQKRLVQIRKTIQQAAPKVTEAISYAMPTFIYNGNLVHFAGYTHHIGFYPAPSAIVAFKKELASYKQSKGAVQFAHTDKLPLDLIKAMVLFRVKESEEKEAMKALKKPSAKKTPAEKTKSKK